MRDVGIESDAGFELGIEMVAKARRRRLPVAEVATIWLDRSAGDSNFKVVAWLPQYLRWYRYTFGPRVSMTPVPNASQSDPDSHVSKSGDSREVPR